MADGDIDEIVRRVVERLNADRSARELVADLPGCDAPTSSSRKSPGPLNEPTSGTLLLQGKVVSMRELEGKWVGLRCVKVSTHALLTPSVREELQRRGIAMERVDFGAIDKLNISGQGVGEHAEPEARFILGTPDLEVLKSQLKGWSLSLESAPACEEDRARRIADQWNDQQRWIWFSLRPHSAFLALIRHGPADMRPVFLHDLADLECAVEQVRPNFVLVNGSRWPRQAVVQLVRRWTKLGLGR